MQYVQVSFSEYLKASPQHGACLCRSAFLTCLFRSLAPLVQKEDSMWLLRRVSSECAQDRSVDPSRPGQVIMVREYTKLSLDAVVAEGHAPPV